MIRGLFVRLSGIYVALSAAGLLLLFGCAATPRPEPEPRVVTVEVPVPVAAPCVPAMLGPAPDYPDTDDALRGAPNAVERYRLVGAGRPLRVGRLKELETVVAGCPKAAK